MVDNNKTYSVIILENYKHIVENTSDWPAQFDIVLHYVRKLVALPRL